MPRLAIPLPRRRRWRIALALAGVLAVYLAALSAVPALLGRGEGGGESRERGLRAVQAENWGLVLPEERAALGRAVDDAWRSLRSYRMRYVTGPPEALAEDRPETEARSSFRLDGKGNIAAQRDTNYISAASPGGTGRDERFEGYRLRTTKPYVNSKGRRVADAEEIYQRSGGGQWICEKVAADRTPPPPPGLDLAAAGDAGFAEIDGRRVRGLVLTAGAFGLRAPATVWIDTATLHVRRQEIASVLRGRREVWTYGGFDEPVEIAPPGGIPCRDT